MSYSLQEKSNHEETKRTKVVFQLSSLSSFLRSKKVAHVRCLKLEKRQIEKGQGVKKRQ
jgi:hypothetical protein